MRYALDSQGRKGVTLIEGDGIGSTRRWMHVETLELHDGALAYTRALGED